MLQMSGIHHALSQLWQRLRHAVPAEIQESEENISRLGEADTMDWRTSCRPAPPFRLDACFEAPGYVPGWMLQNPAGTAPLVAPTPLADAFGNVLAKATMGQEALLAAHYRRILAAAPDWRQWRNAHRGCFDVDLVINIEGEHLLRLEMFNGAAAAADELLTQLADAQAPPNILYDNLDQGWALRMESTPEAVLTLEWNWEIPAAADSPRALRFPRKALAAQAGEALLRLRHVRATLIQELGTDLWNQPPPEPRRRRWAIWT